MWSLLLDRIAHPQPPGCLLQGQAVMHSHSVASTIINVMSPATTIEERISKVLVAGAAIVFFDARGAVAAPPAVAELSRRRGRGGSVTKQAISRKGNHPSFAIATGGTEQFSGGIS
jgi:hypothetical protein